MIEYKIDVIKELNKIGINTYSAKKTGILSQSTMDKLKKRDPNISIDNLNRLCCLLELQPRDIFKYVETSEDKEKIISKIRDL